MTNDLAMSDLISRKEAIEKIESHTRVGDELYPLTDTDKILNHAFEIAASCVYNLPSAQPEPIKVSVDHAMTEEELKELKQKIADSPVILLPSAQPEREDYTEMKQEFLRMASYIDVLLECSDEQKETLMGFISRLSEYMPWTERD